MAQQDDVVVSAKEPRVHDDAFQRTPDPKFCYLDPARRHVSAHVLSRLCEGDGLCTLTGQPGIGKTTLLHHLAEQLLALDRVLLLCPVHVLTCRTRTTLADVLGACEANLGLGEWGATSPLKAAKRLQQLVESNRSPVLLLDDADLLADDVLEDLVTLTGLQAAERRLLSIVLAGQPSILGRVSTITGDEMLGAGRTVKLEPMAAPDVARLIRHRLRAAGRPEDAIGPDAIAQIARHSAGVPGAVVHVCRRVMQLAETWSRTSVTADIVTEAIGEATFDVKRGSSPPRVRCACTHVDRDGAFSAACTGFDHH
jgi:general secretion pathway protein A